MAGPAGAGNLDDGNLQAHLVHVDGAAFPGDDDKGKGVLVHEQVSADRRMILMGDPKDPTDEDDDEYVFEEDVEASADAQALDGDCQVLFW